MKKSQLKELLYKKVSSYYPGRLKELTVLNIKMNSTVRVKVAPLFDIRNVSLEPTIYTRCDSYETSFRKGKELKVVVNPAENFIIAIILYRLILHFLHLLFSLAFLVVFLVYLLAFYIVCFEVLH